MRATGVLYRLAVAVLTVSFIFSGDALAQTANVPAAELFPGLGGPTPTSNPALDFQTSVIAGFTQSETSTAWCGNNVVSAYNDSGAYVRTFGVDPAGAISLARLRRGAREPN